MTTKIRIKKGDDFHVHLRTGNILEDVAYFTARQFKRALIMPNTNPPILDWKDAARYQRDILFLVPWLTPLMSIQINGETTPGTIAAAKEVNVVAGKIYPQGVTTNSENGVADFKAIYPALETMEKVGMLALFHGEDPWKGATCLDREKLFLPILYQISSDFPKLRIVLEHITTEDAVRFIESLSDNVAATITPHHLMLTIDDVVGNLIQTHNFCKPIAKMPNDRTALLKAATSGNPKFFFGSDSAPHLREKKECACGCAGVFNSPIAMPLLCQIFEEQDAINKLEAFVSHFGASFYGLPKNDSTIELERANYLIPSLCNGIVPFMADQYLNWQIVK